MPGPWPYCRVVDCFKMAIPATGLCLTHMEDRPAPDEKFNQDDYNVEENQ